MKAWDNLVGLVIRPPRAEYTVDALGDEVFALGVDVYRREDKVITNKRGMALECSRFFKADSGKLRPCIIYLHGNCGCRLDALDMLEYMLPLGCDVFCFDFAGSGLSEGEHVSLGWHEKDDLACVVDYLRSEVGVTTIGLWGRSMGAATALLYAVDDPTVAGMVLDSPFSDLPSLMIELAKSYKSSIPTPLIKLALSAVRRSVKKKCKFDIKQVSPAKAAASCFVPALFAHGSSDTFIPPVHSEKVLEAYQGEKNRITFDGDHNSARPSFLYDSAFIFFKNVLYRGDASEAANLVSPPRSYQSSARGGGGDSSLDVTPLVAPPVRILPERDEVVAGGEEEEEDIGKSGEGFEGGEMLSEEEEAELAEAMRLSLQTYFETEAKTEKAKAQVSAEKRREEWLGSGEKKEGDVAQRLDFSHP